MNVEIGEIDGRIGWIVVRLVCGLFGLYGIVMLSIGLISWLRDSSAYPSVWNAMVGYEPYCRIVRHGVNLGGGILWKTTPNGMLPAFWCVGLSVLLIAASLFNRLWIYLFAVLMMFYLVI